ncbi:Efflux pump bik6 [Pseudocercospora fuligena]|uniref:Cercosporin MFS transporter CTB4 n=1 Tax=Pseudocercospora fuligena TaxID=685502 RepID=A0A8H6RC00_9PEZI|nr:Efflux pump bik6 [Pseudocercospora fuligena]
MDFRSEQQRLQRPDETEVEQRETREAHEESSPEFEKAETSTPEDEDDASSIFSERHMEGPPSLRSPSLRRPSTSQDSAVLSRTTSRRISRTQTAASTAIARIRSRVPRPAFTHPLTHEKTAIDVIVEFDGPEDPYRPMDWTWKKKAITTLLYGFTAMGATFASSVYSPAVKQISEEFGIGNEVSTLGISLFLIGFGIGPLFWAPLSEVYGRKLAVLIPFFIPAIFAFGGGAAKDVQTLMICRFWQGIFGSAPVTNTGGVLGDIWTPAERGAAMVAYAMAVVGGPTLGPIIGGAFIVGRLGWRWTQYITGILMMFQLVLDVVFVDESYPPALLVTKARRLRHESGNWALHAKHEEWDVSLVELGHKYLVRPFQLLATPICALMALYASFCYGILYASLAAFPIEFEEERGWNSLVGSLPFLAMLVGIMFGACANFLNQKFYVARWKANDYRPVPEARLPPMMGGSILFAAGLFVFAWTSDKDLPWIAPCIGIAMEGVGFFTIFQAALNYLIDTFQRYAASAVAANTALRSAFAAAFPLFISPMLHNMGIDWGISVFGFIAVAMIPIPYCFYVFGKRIRARGTWSRESVYPDEKPRV